MSDAILCDIRWYHDFALGNAHLPDGRGVWTMRSGPSFRLPGFLHGRWLRRWLRRRRRARSRCLSDARDPPPSWATSSGPRSISSICCSTTPGFTPERGDLDDDEDDAAADGCEDEDD